MGQYSHLEATIYNRVSRLDDGRSTRDQDKLNRAWCANEDIRVGAVFTDDGISASRFGKKRDEWEALKAHLRKGQILVAWEASRTTRDMEEWVALRNLCASREVPLAYAGRVLDFNKGDDRFVGGLDALISERESEQLRVRVLRGKRSAAEQGKPSGPPPWGYTRVDVAVWEPDPVEAPRVQETARRLIAGESLHSVLKWVRDTPGRYPTDITMLRRCMSNPTLAGLRVHQGEVVGKGTWKAIITEKQHKALLLRFGRAKAVRNFQEIPGPEPKHLLSMLAKCEVCGKGLRHKTYKDRKNIYTCPSSHVSRIADELDNIVENELFNLLSIAKPRESKADDDPVTSQLLAELKEAEDELEGWRQDAENFRVTRISFMRMEKALGERIDGLKERLLDKPIETLDIDKATGNWPDLPMREKRRFLRAFLDVSVPPRPKTAAGGRTRATKGDVNIVRR